MFSEKNYRGNPIAEKLAKMQVKVDHQKAMEQPLDKAPAANQGSTSQQETEEEKK